MTCAPGRERTPVLRAHGRGGQKLGLGVQNQELLPLRRAGHVDSECAQGRRGGLAEHDGDGGASVFARVSGGRNRHIARSVRARRSSLRGDLRQTLTGGAGGPTAGRTEARRRSTAPSLAAAAAGGRRRRATDGPWGRGGGGWGGERRAAGRWCDLGRARSGPGMGDGETEVGAGLIR